MDKQYLAKLLVHGIPQTQVAAAMGCTQGYISQLVASDDELAKEINLAEARVAAVRVKKDEKLETIERGLITRTIQLMDETDSLGEAVGALQKVTDMRERQAVRQQGGGGSGQVLELNLGKLAEAQLSVVMGGNRVIMNIGGKDMTRAPSTTVRDMAQRAKEREAEDESWKEGHGLGYDEDEDKFLQGNAPGLAAAAQTG